MKAEPNRRALCDLLTERCVWKALWPMFFALALTAALLARHFRGDVLQPELSMNRDVHAAGYYVELTAERISDCFASDRKRSYYFVVDRAGYSYVAAMKESDWERLTADAGGRAELRLTGITVETPAALREIVCSCFTEIAAEEYEDYFGPAFLDCTARPTNRRAHAAWCCAGVLVLWGDGAILLLILRKRSVEDELELLEECNDVRRLICQLRSTCSGQRVGPLIVTEDYFVDLRHGRVRRVPELGAIRVTHRAGLAELRTCEDSGAWRRLITLSAKRLPALKKAFAYSAALRELYTGSFERPDYWHYPEAARP